MKYHVASVMRVVCVGVGLAVVGSTANAEAVFEKKSPSNQNDIIYGGRGVSDRSAAAGICSLILPGVGQAINKNTTPKIITHAVIGLLGFVAVAHPVGFVFAVFHVWSGWDALIDRRGGYINGAVLGPDPTEWIDASVDSASSSC